MAKSAKLTGSGRGIRCIGEMKVSEDAYFRCALIDSDAARGSVLPLDVRYSHHLDYRPLFNARAHPGLLKNKDHNSNSKQDNQILNVELRGTYRSFIQKL